MKRTSTMLMLLVALAGCGVTQEVYKAEFNRAREAEARAEDCAARLEAQTARLEATQANRDAFETESKKLAAERDRLAASLTESKKDLDTCWTVREGVGGDLDVARKMIRSEQEEAERLRNEASAREEAHRAEFEACETRSDEIHARLETLRGRVAVIEAERDLLSEERRRAEREREESLAEVSGSYEKLLSGMKEEVDKGRIEISELRGQLSVKLLDEVLFDSGRADVKKEGREVLDHVASALATLGDRAILIEGHTDDVPIRGGLAERFPSNWELSAARAVSVVRYLAERGGVEPGRIGAVGYGEYRPVESNQTPEGRAKNRRIEILLVPLEPKAEAPASEEADAAEAERPTTESAMTEDVAPPESAPAEAPAAPASNP